MDNKNCLELQSNYSKLELKDKDMKKSECKHINKVYESDSYTFTSTFGSTITNWICKDCGEEGVQVNPPPRNEYEEVKQKFAGSKTITI